MASITRGRERGHVASQLLRRPTVPASLPGAGSAVWPAVVVVGLLPVFVAAATDWQGQAALWESLHWTISALAALAIAAAAVRGIAGPGRRVRLLATLGLASFAAGSLVWDLQVAFGSYLVPAPSDGLFLAAPVLIAGAAMIRARGALAASDTLALALDGLMVVLSIATAVLFIFAPVAQGARPGLGLILLAYPIVFIGLAGFLLLSAAASGDRVRSGGIYILSLGLALTGAVWAIWIESALYAAPRAGDPLNAVGSIATVVAAAGIATWAPDTRQAAGIGRAYALSRSLIPILAVAAAVVFLIVTRGDDALPGWDVVDVAAWSVIALAILRQTILLVDRTTLVGRERTLRAEAQRALAAETESEARYRRLVTVFGRLAERLTFAADEDQMLAAGAAAINDIGMADRGEIALLNPSHDRLSVALAWGSESRAVGTVIEVESPLSCFGIRRSGPYLLEDVNEPFAVPCPVLPVASGSVMCVPMIANGQTVGVLHVNAAGSFTDDHREQLLRITEQLGLAIANARLVRTMEGLALRDSLTGLYNGRFFDPYLERELAHAQRDGTSVGVVMIDIDHFKRFNDTYGHPSGDEALRIFARTALGAIRESDTLARYGGEEFVLLVRDGDIEATVRTAERVRVAVESTVIDLGPGRSARITASFGAAASALNGTDRLPLLRSADRALYRAKQSGRNRVVAADLTRPSEAESSAAGSGDRAQASPVPRAVN